MNIRSLIERVLSWVLSPMPDWLRALVLPNQNILIALLTVVSVFAVSMLLLLIMIWMERKVLGRLQDRRGTQLALWGGRKGFGFIQNIADGIKFFLKEDTIPARGDRWTFAAAPTLLILSSFTAIAAIPISSGFFVADLPGGLLFAVAVFSFAPFAIFLGGWGANNKYTLLGGMRSAAQMTGSEVPLLLSIVGIVMVTGSFRFADIVSAQASPIALGGGLTLPAWFIFTQPLAFAVFFIALVAELERIPFDLPEAEAELVEGWITEYSGMKFAMGMMAGYLRGFVGCAVAVLVFLGGWRGPVSDYIVGKVPYIPEEAVFVGKVLVLFFILIVIRAAMPRVRTDQLLNIGWKRLMPVAMANILALFIGITFWPEITGALGGG